MLIQARLAQNIHLLNQKTSSSDRFAPDVGEYLITPEWLFSKFKWTYDNPNFSKNLYQHEFRIKERGYTGIGERRWDTNLPGLGRLTVEDNIEGQNYKEMKAL
ncbi:hypothetical protein M1N11_05395 [Peptococcaceae bacterium]|nr:hypothetical protein [Peptococcaceae bacterium]